MQKIFFLLLFFCTSIAVAQKKRTITQRNFEELKLDSARAEQDLELAKLKLVHVEETVGRIASQKIMNFNKSGGGYINEDSVYETVKKQKKAHFEIAYKRIEKLQKHYDKVIAKYQFTKLHDSIIPNKFMPVIEKGAYISFNPMAVVEAQQGAIGLGVGYRVTKRIEFFAESSYLFKGLQTIDDNFKSLK